MAAKGRGGSLRISTLLLAGHTGDGGTLEVFLQALASSHSEDYVKSWRLRGVRAELVWFLSGCAKQLRRWPGYLLPGGGRRSGAGARRTRRLRDDVRSMVQAKSFGSLRLRPIPAAMRLTGRVVVRLAGSTLNAVTTTKEGF